MAAYGEGIAQVIFLFSPNPIRQVGSIDHASICDSATISYEAWLFETSTFWNGGGRQLRTLVALTFDDFDTQPFARLGAGKLGLASSPLDRYGPRQDNTSHRAGPCQSTATAATRTPPKIQTKINPAKFYCRPLLRPVLRRWYSSAQLLLPASFSTDRPD